MIMGWNFSHSSINIYFVVRDRYLLKEINIWVRKCLLETADPEIPNWQMDFENKYLQAQIEESENSAAF